VSNCIVPVISKNACCQHSRHARAETGLSENASDSVDGCVLGLA
jgi:hypothetical protein